MTKLIYCFCAFEFLFYTSAMSQCSPPAQTSLSCGNTVSLNLGAAGYTADDPTSGNSGCNPCCWVGSDLDCDGEQDVPWSVENSRWYKYCNNTGLTQTVIVNVDEPGTGSSCNLQGAMWVGTTLNSATLSCSNAGYQQYDSNPGGAADGFTFPNVTVADGECVFFMVDGYAGNQCSGIGITVDCPACTAPTLSNTQVNVSCNGGSDGSINLSVTGGTSPYTYIWSNGATTQDIANVAAGNYLVTVTGGGCQSFLTAAITQPSVLATSVSSTVAGCGGVSNNGTATATPSGGTSPYTYLWSNSQTTSTATALTGGSYSVTVTDNKGCANTATVTVNQPLITITPASATICQGDTVTLSSLIFPYPATVQDTFSLNPNVAIPNNDVNGVNSTITVSGITQGTLAPGDVIAICFTITHTKQADIGNNGSPDAVTITSPAGVTYNSGITPLNGNGTKTYCFLVSVLNTITGSPNGTWTINIKDTRGSGGGTGTLDSWYIIINNQNPVTYTWSPTTDMINSGTLSPSVFPSSTTTYTLSATDFFGCTFTQTVTITVTTPPVAPTAAGITICSGSTATLTATAPGGTYQWYDAATGGSLLFTGAAYTTPALSSSVTYYVQTTVGGCTGPRTPVTVNINPVLTVSGLTVTCNGGTYTVSFTISGGNPASYSVTGGAGTLTGSSFTSDTITSGNSYSFTASDTYNCTPQTVSGSQNCACSASATVSGGGTVCSGTTPPDIVITLAGTATWEITYNINGIPQTPVMGIASSPYNITNPSAGTYTVSAVSDANCSGSGSGSATVTINTLPSATVSGGGAICNDGSTDTVSIALTGTGPWNITYAINGTPQAPVTGINSSPYTFFTSTPGTYTVTAVSDANCNGTSGGSATIVVNPLPAPVITPGGATAFCQGDSVLLTSTAVVNYIWSTGESNQSITVATSGNYTVTVTDGNGCSGASSPIAVTVNANPAPAITAGGSTTFCTGDSVQLSSSFETAYLWSTGTTTQSIYTSATGNYDVTVTDGNGCTGKASATVNVNLNPSVTTSSTGENCGASDGTATASGGGGTPPFTYQWDAATGNQATATATGLSAGTYTITVTDTNSCFAVSSATVSSLGGLTAAVFATAATCGNCNGTGEVSPSGGTSPYTYLWDASAGNQSSSAATGLCGGTFSVTVTDASGGGGCTFTAFVIISVTPAVAVATDSTDASCGLNNGEATTYPSAGTSPFGYNWSNGQTGQTATGLAVGPYSVTVTDANGCTTSDSVSVNAITSPAVNVTAVGASCNGGSNGQATATVSAGASPYTFLWSGGQSTSTISGLPAGTWYITITDANSCTDVDSAAVTEPAAVVALITNTVDATCGASDGSATVTPSGATPPCSYLWNDLLSQTDSTATGLSSGSYSVTVTDSQGCTGTASVSIGNTGAAVITGIVTDVLCNGGATGSVDITVSGGTPPLTYSWSNSALTEDISGLSQGIYAITVTDASSCLGFGSFTVSEPLILTVTLSQVDVSCNGGNDGTATATPSGGTPGYSYLWNTAPAQYTSTATGLTAGNYSITVSDTNNCSSLQAVIITEPLVLTASVSGQTDVLCFGGNNGTATAAGSGGTSPYSFMWSTVPPQNSAGATGLNAGNYTVTITDNNSCSATVNAAITEPAALTSSIPSATNLNCSGICTGTADVSATGGILPYSYLWSNGQSVTTATGLCASTVTVTVTDNNACASTSNILITEPPPMIATASSIPATCNGGNDGNATATTTGGSGSYTWLWSTIPAQSAATATGLSAGGYTITVTDSLSCTDTANVTVTEPASLQALISGNMSICEGQSTTLTSISSASYQWSTGETTQSVIVAPISDSTYFVTITDASGCTADTEATVTVNANPIAEAGNDEEICAGKIVQLNASSIPAATSYTWIPVTGLSDATIANPYASPAATTIYTVTASIGNCTGYDSVTVTVDLLPVVELGADVTINQGESYTLNATGGGTYSWVPVTDLTCSNCPDPSASPATTTKYIVMVTDTNQCVATDSITINVEIKCEVVFVPNIFSPNGDGQNDVFKIYGTNCVKALNLLIYDRWGEKVFETGNINEGWNGSYNGKILNAGVFVWLLKGEMNNGDAIDKQGNVAIVK